ncbi:MAG: anhydro-N-acetylmuramic acid kinase [Mariprofundus sp.]|nr:anhydro-N-acetylmuramic acid kinase [Mariprofundus sp.]
MNRQLLIGIMSGTSADGIDIAIVDFANNSKLIYFSEYPMPPKLRDAILHLTEPRFGEIDNLGWLDKALGYAYADAALSAIKAADLKSTDISAIGNHGQTIRHRPAMQYSFSLQIGCAATIAELTGITTISNFRSRDMAAGGQGAPLVPFAHQRLFADPNQNTVVLNLGGIANITWLGVDGSVCGFDTGPGNMLMDALIYKISDGKQTFDENGQLAASGSVNTALVEKLMRHSFLHKPPPKSTGREDFGSEIVKQILNWPDISDADRMATTCQFTVDSIAQNTHFLPENPDRWLCCGGGVRNRHLMRLLEKQLAPASVSTTQLAGLPPQAVEAVCFALLARQTLLGEANTLAAVTGAEHNVCGGQITPGENWQDLLQSIPAWIR